MDFQVNIPSPFQAIPESAVIIFLILILLGAALLIFSNWIQGVIPYQTRQYIKIGFMALILVFIILAIKKPEYITALF